jgi:hypothetical protein
MFWLENQEDDKCAGDESGTDRDPLRVNAHAGVTEPTEPAKVLWGCLEAAGQEKDADDPDHDC